MAERPEDLNLPNSVVARIIKEAVRKQKHTTVNTCVKVDFMYNSIPLFLGGIYGKNYYLHPCISPLSQLLIQQFSFKNLTYTRVFTVYKS